MDRFPNVSVPIARTPPLVAAEPHFRSIVEYTACSFTLESPFGEGIVFGDVLQPLHTNIGDEQGYAACPAGHMDRGAPADHALRWIRLVKTVAAAFSHIAVGTIEDEAGIDRSNYGETFPNPQAITDIPPPAIIRRVPAARLLLYPPRL